MASLTPGMSDGQMPWSALLDEAAPGDHIVQLYQDDEFLSRAVCRFAASALAHGEGVILVPTVEHWDGIRPRLEAEGVDTNAAMAQGQLTVIDGNDLLPSFMQNNMPDGPLFLGLAGQVIERARMDNRYPKVRWWGEMVDILWERGDVSASMGLEDLFHQLARDESIAIFCSFLMDNFDGDIQTRMLPRLGQNHTHLIPVQDYARLERAVAAALHQAVGAAEADVLEKRLSQADLSGFNMPRSQALLLALRETLPQVADTVLQKTRALYASDSPSVPENVPT